MWTWWDSLEAVSRLSLLVKWIAAGGAIVGAVCGVLVLISTKRVDTLREKRDALIRQQAQATEKELRDRLEGAEERLKGRHLTLDQEAVLLDALKNQPERITISCPTGSTTEPCDFAKELTSVFEVAGWKVQLVTETFAGIPTVGLILLVRDLKHPPAKAVFLEEAFRAIQLPVSWLPIAEDRVTLLVGFKP
jgi:hypothetical protein